MTARRVLLVLSLAVAVACAVEEGVGPDLLSARGGDPIVLDTVLPQLVERTIYPAAADTARRVARIRYCWFGGLKSGRIAMRAQDAAACGGTYRAAFTAEQRAVTRREQAIVDTVRITWASTLAP